jgi:hypothetical protein
MFEKMLTKPVEKMLCKILEDDKISKGKEKGFFVVTRGEDSIEFTANKKPVAGDYVIQDENGNYKVDPEYVEEFFYTEGLPEAEECRCAELEEENKALLEVNEQLEKKLEGMNADENAPVVYNPDKEEGLSFKEAEAACKEGKAVSRKAWRNIFMTYHEKFGLMSNIPNCKPKAIVPDEASLQAKDFFVVDIEA